MGKLPFYYKHRCNKCNVCPIIFKRQNINYVFDLAINSARKVFLNSSSVKDGGLFIKTRCILLHVKATGSAL